MPWPQLIWPNWVLKSNESILGLKKSTTLFWRRLRWFCPVLRSKTSLKKRDFFKKMFLVANISVKVILDIFFLTLSNADILFVKRKLTWRSYTPAKALLITKRMQIISWKKFVAAALHLNKEAFIVQMAYLGSKILIYWAWKI